MKSIGLTGGIGSGKSTVATIFESMGYAVYYADTRAKALYTEDAEVHAGVSEMFGQGIWLPDGQPDRAQIASVVFKDKDKLKALNALIHPAVGRDHARWHDELVKNGYSKGFALKEAAILYEAGTHAQQDGVIMVYAPKSLRLTRVMKRGNETAAAVLARMANQWADSKKALLSDFIIFNDEIHALIPQVLAAARYFAS